MRPSLFSVILFNLPQPLLGYGRGAESLLFFPGLAMLLVERGNLAAVECFVAVLFLALGTVVEFVLRDCVFVAALKLIGRDIFAAREAMARQIMLVAGKLTPNAFLAI